MAVKKKTSAAPAAVLSPRALGRATLERQLLLRRAVMSAEDAVRHLVGLQAQNTKPPYFQLLARLEGFEPDRLAALMESRRVVRIVTLRSTIHTHTADDALTLRPLVQEARDRELRIFRKGLVGVDLDRLRDLGRVYVEEAPRTPKEIRERLLTEWPDADPQALGTAARCLLPLVQITPRGVWGKSGQVALTTAEHWLGRPSAPVPPPDGTVLRYLAAFGPASVKDMQSWAGLTRLREVFERLRPQLVTFRDENGVELFDLPDAPRPDEDTPAPPRFLPEFDNVLLGHADRTRVIPPPLKGRNGVGNQAYGSVLVDGFLAAIWRLEAGGAGTPATVTVQELRPFTAAERDEVTDEAVALLSVMTKTATGGDGGNGGDVRFASFVDFGD
ncbi:winged helix DNA-binding domain-containing protein [Streptomyces poriferorum]|uniref:Winged helix DNA-binding domain-containing protein n=1 Tax=Streptomyces poriferorum TaxID=2798799 RepID=A0ABY9ILU9_9ACTN|nr:MULTISPECIES: winged helix DNA-binding domain-containing protein [unclassified Streptomyces]MDP5317092.1 winged helix DNA-binding domain-containing protein [Streptomyces sp. Alt4]WLQ55364.1 winged helix DNA-binding domain-containing protein [Streptomyces sp. Alt2]